MCGCSSVLCIFVCFEHEQSKSDIMMACWLVLFPSSCCCPTKSHINHPQWYCHTSAVGGGTWDWQEWRNYLPWSTSRSHTVSRCQLHQCIRLRTSASGWWTGGVCRVQLHHQGLYHCWPRAIQCCHHQHHWPSWWTECLHNGNMFLTLMCVCVC